MTCAHVLGLIDAGSAAGYPPAHLAAAWQHAETCPECGPALAVSRDVTRGLADWPDAVAPPDLAAAVMTRIALVDEVRAMVAAEAPAPMLGQMNWSALATALGGLTACAALAWSAAAGGAAVLRVVGPGLGGLTAGGTGGASWPALPEGLALAAGLALYLVGLFAPVAGRATVSGSAASR